MSIYTAAPDTTTTERYLDYLHRLTWRAPYAVSKFTAPQVQQVLRDWIPQRRFDVAVCDFLSSTLNFPEKLATPTALFQHNVETVLWKRKAEVEVKLLERLVSKIEYAKMRRFEPEQTRRFHHVIAVSEADRQAMSSMVDLSHVSVVPNIIDSGPYSNSNAGGGAVQCYFGKPAMVGVLDNCWSNYSFTENVIIITATNNNWPAGNYAMASNTAVGFVNFNGGVGRQLSIGCE